MKKKPEPIVKIVLPFCRPCKAAVLEPAAGAWRDGWQGLPKLCPPCEAKLAQAARMLAVGGVVVPRASNISAVPGGVAHETRRRK